MKVELYHGEGSNCCQRIKWILAYKKIRYEAIDCTEMPPAEYEKINPFRTAPTLVIDGQVVLESMAQAELLEELNIGESLLPKGVWLRTRVREVCLVMAASVHPLQTNKAARLARPDGSPEDLKRYRANVIHQQLLKLERILFKESAFCVGSEFSMADVFVIPLYLKAVGFDPACAIPSYDRLVRACRDNQAVRLASPSDMIGLR